MDTSTTFGAEVIPPSFEDARAFSEGLAAVKIAGKWGYLAPDGSMVIANQFICERGMAGPFRDGLARVARSGLWGHIRRSGEFAYKPRFDMAYEFCEGYAVVTVGKRQGYIDPRGEIVVPATYLYAHNFSEGLGAVNTGTGEPHDSGRLPVKSVSSTERVSS